MSCNLCHQTRFNLIANTDAKSGAPLNVYFCEFCGLIQQSPLPSADQLHDYYSTSYRLDYKGTWHPKPKHIFRSVRCARSRLEFLRKSGIRDGLLLDIGASSGEFVALARQAGFDASGVEPNQGYAEYARSEYHILVTTAGLNQIEGQYDVITLFHVLEHLLSPAEVFQHLHSLLKPDGKLFIEVPWVLSGSIAPSNRYFKAHLYYFDVETLQASASAYFDVISTCVLGNLRMIMQPRPAIAPLSLPSADYLAALPARLHRQGWLNYLTHGGGFFKLADKVHRLWQENRVSRLRGREIITLCDRLPK
jgi:2-polyprenyl-3-methyl-5-hydroxy-6-metoxy-1,4-benzoquinol methylase